jgi:hypothetical protein
MTTRRITLLMAICLSSAAASALRDAPSGLLRANGLGLLSMNGLAGISARPDEVQSAVALPVRPEEARSAVALPVRPEEARSAVSKGQPPLFRPVAVYIDSGGVPLAAYQVEIIARGDARIVGVEGGESGAFHNPPYYDPAALQGGRIILAAFNTGSDLPRGRTRVATLHMRQAQADVTYEAKLIAAAGQDGRRISAKVETQPEGEER